MAAASPRSAPPSRQLLRLAWGFYLVLALLGLLWIGARVGKIPVSLFVRQGARIDLLIGFGLGCVLAALWAKLEQRLLSARELAALLRARLGRLERSEALSLALLSGFAEEFFFRGAVQGAWGFGWATVLFALLHSGPGRALRLWLLFAALAGGLFGGLMLWRENLLGPVVAHATVNAFNLLRLTVPKAADQGP